MDEPQSRADLRLVEYRPRSRLRAGTAELRARPSFPAIDAHNHLGPTPFADGWDRRAPVDLEAALDASNIAAIVDLDGGWGDALRRELEHWSPLGDRVAVFAGLEYAMWAERPDFGDVEAARLREAAAAGARGLKVWKTLGLRARDPAARLVPVDDPRLDALWATAGALSLPVTIHVADPIAFFEPLDPANERYEELLAHPDWHFWQTRERGQPDRDGFPPFDEILDGLEAVIARHPATTFIGAHVGCAAEDLGRVDRMLDAYPNWNVDIAARISELGRRPYSARDFLMRRSDRILFGTDAAPDPAAWAVYARFLETHDESFPYDADGGPGSQGRWQIHGVALPDPALEAIYATNARRLIFGSPMPAGPGGA